jgi:hypothetical protein
VGHNFGDKTLVDDVTLLLVIIDIIHANGDKMSMDNLLSALIHYGVPSKSFFKYGKRREEATMWWERVSGAIKKQI